MQCSVPCNIDKSNERFGVVCADPSKTVMIHARVPVVIKETMLKALRV